jgi:hypothetical protein
MNAAALQQHRVLDAIEPRLDRSNCLLFPLAPQIFQFVTGSLFVPARSFISPPISGYACATL